MQVLQTLPALIVLGALGLADGPADAQVVATRPGDVVVSGPPPVVVDDGFVVKERRRLFRPRERVYIVKPRSKRISVPATTAVVESAPVVRSTVIEAPAPIVTRPSTVVAPPSRVVEPPDAMPDLDQPEPEAEVRYLKPAEPIPAPAASPAQPSAVIRSTPRGS